MTLIPVLYSSVQLGEGGVSNFLWLFFFFFNKAEFVKYNKHLLHRSTQITLTPYFSSCLHAFKPFFMFFQLDQLVIDSAKERKDIEMKHSTIQQKVQELLQTLITHKPPAITHYIGPIRNYSFFRATNLFLLRMRLCSTLMKTETIMLLMLFETEYPSLLSSLWVWPFEMI